MAVTPAARARHLDRLREARPNVRDRAMFGMIAYWSEDVLFGLADETSIYLKADAINAADFPGREPWSYDDRPNGPYRALTEAEATDPARLADLIEGSLAAAVRMKKT